MNFKKINSITGWVIFAIASAVYLLTIEPTASFWDCGEFISSAYGLEVGHPPGAPFFMLIARVFTLFAGNDVTLVAKMVNTFSALCSAFTILLLFWSITHLGRKLAGKAIDELTPTQALSIIGAGIVGALAYTFSDTFWFSAIEGEVYAFSSLFTALVFWAILRWEDETDRRYATRWLVLIAYLIGLSIGVHLLNLLAIPAIGLVIYYKKYPVTTKGTIIALMISSAVLLFILYGIVPGVIQIAAWFELMFVNGFNLPIHTGLYIYILLFAGGIIFGLWYSLKHKKIVLNTTLLLVSVIVIGYSSYAALIIRSSAEPPMDQNNPQNLFNLQYYLNREQYGDRPLFSGPYFNSSPVDYKEGKTLYVAKNGKYVENGRKIDYVYKTGETTIFPRMYSTEQNHVIAYKEWSGISAQQSPTKLPTFGENLRFFFSYQLNFMYLRYFYWNFVGRQNDIQGLGNPVHGNWISGIRFLDEARLGPQDLPESLSNKGRNVYFGLPLFLGFIGMIFQFRRNRPNFWVTLMLFFMTGIAIVVYLNQTPYQPRERDYAYAGSFYAYAIWIGLGVMAIIDAIPEKLKNKYTTVLITALLLLLVPGIMAKENWDDHDRSGRYTTRDLAYNYLASCDPNAIIFTNGDNDTFPLWYIQEVEGERRDIRVVNLSYFSADWYIEQMARKAYESDPLPFSLQPDQYASGVRDVVYVHDLFKNQYEELKDVMDFVASEDVRSKGIMTADGIVWNSEMKAARNVQLTDFLPAKNLKITVDKQEVLNSGTVPLKDSARIVPEIKWTLKGEGTAPREMITKSSMMVLDILANNNWKRPVYFATTVSSENFLNLSSYFQLDGLAYRFVPIESQSPYPQEIGSVDAEKLYDKMMNQFRWGNISDPDVYLDETNRRLLTHLRSNFARLSNALIMENKVDSAITVLDRAFEVIPTYQLPLGYTDVMLVEQYYNAKAFEKGNTLAEELFRIAKEEMDYYRSFPGRYNASLELQRQGYYTVSVLTDLARIYEQDALFEKFDQYLKSL